MNKPMNGITKTMDLKPWIYIHSMNGYSTWSKRSAS
uniref:Uncharacterized protein n=1 Tax=Arundo donax TaxID=35708 RepID=A0A0A9BWU8_ARUDO